MSLSIIIIYICRTGAAAGELGLYVELWLLCESFVHMLVLTEVAVLPLSEQIAVVALTDFLLPPVGQSAVLSIFGVPSIASSNKPTSPSEEQEVMLSPSGELVIALPPGELATVTAAETPAVLVPSWHRWTVGSSLWQELQIWWWQQKHRILINDVNSFSLHTVQRGPHIGGGSSVGQSRCTGPPPPVWPPSKTPAEKKKKTTL